MDSVGELYGQGRWHMQEKADAADDSIANSGAFAWMMDTTLYSGVVLSVTFSQSYPPKS